MRLPTIWTAHGPAAVNLADDGLHRFGVYIQDRDCRFLLGEAHGPRAPHGGPGSRHLPR